MQCMFKLLVIFWYIWGACWRAKLLQVCNKMIIDAHLSEQGLGEEVEEEEVSDQVLLK